MSATPQPGGGRGAAPLTTSWGFLAPYQARLESGCGVSVVILIAVEEFHRTTSRVSQLDRAAGINTVDADPHTYGVLHYPGVFSGRHLVGRADYGSGRTDDSFRRPPHDLIWHLSRRGRGNGANYATDRIQSIRTAGNGRTRNHLRGASRATDILSYVCCRWFIDRYACTCHFPAGSDIHGPAVAF